MPGPTIAIIAGVLAILLFAVLNAQRQSARTTSLTERGQVNAFAPPPVLTVPPEPAPEQPKTALITIPPMEAQPPERPLQAPAVPQLQIMPPAPPAPSPATTPVQQERPVPNSTTSALVIDAGVPINPTVPAVGGQPSNGPGGAGTSARQGAGIGGDDAPARAAVIGSRTTIMPVGTLIPAVLETPIDTARPGLVRALVSQDARGFDGSRVLVPRGSRLIGEYQSDVRSGQNRVLVTWTRLIRPDGVAIRLGSPAADPLGGAGVPGHVNTFFFQRFASAVLQSALTVGVNLASRPGNGSVIVGIPGSAVNTVGQSLLPGNDLRPKITVKQGEALNVFVARDLDFSGVPSRP